MIIEWSQIFSDLLSALWQGVLEVLPRLVGAIIVFAVGSWISALIGRGIAEIFRKLRFNQLFEKGNWKAALERAELKVDASSFIGAIFRWILTIVFLLWAVQILGFGEVRDFLTQVLAYLPNVIVSAFILVVAVVIADILEKVVRATVESSKVGYGSLAGAIVKWSIWIFTVIAILLQLGVAPMLIQTLLTGVIALIVIAGGLAFGLGGKDMAADILRDLQKRFKA